MTTQPAPQEIIPADSYDDAAVLAQVIADAFHTLPPARWLIPGDAARRDVFPGLFQIFTEHALTHGFLYTTPCRTGAAVWLPVAEDGPAPPPATVTGWPRPPGGGRTGSARSTPRLTTTTRPAHPTITSP